MQGSLWTKSVRPALWRTVLGGKGQGVDPESRMENFQHNCPLSYYQIKFDLFQFLYLNCSFSHLQDQSHCNILGICTLMFSLSFQTFFCSHFALTISQNFYCLSSNQHYPMVLSTIMVAILGFHSCIRNWEGYISRNM